MTRGAALWIALLVSCPAAAEPLLVGAAASLREPLTQIASEFAAQRSVAVSSSFGASSAVAQQIRVGAPVDVFVSADLRWVEDLQRRGLVEGPPAAVAGNRLVVIAAEGGPSAIRGPRDLLDPAVRRIALPDHAVPVGRYAREWLRGRGLLEELSPRVLPTEHARATLVAVDAGHADAAIVYATDARMARTATVAFVVESSQHPEIVYAAVVVAGSRDPHLARDFLAHLTSDESREVFARAGFLPPARLPDASIEPSE